MKLDADNEKWISAWVTTALKMAPWIPDTVENRLAFANVLRAVLRPALALADEVAVLVRRKVVDARSPAGDALLDFREPPSSPRADRLAALEREVDQLKRTLMKKEEKQRLETLAADLNEWSSNQELAERPSPGRRIP